MAIKPYTWEEIKSFLVWKLNKTKHILTWGTIGSCNIENDIDFIITKKPNSKTSDFYREIHEIYDSLDIFLYRKYNCNLFRFAISPEQFLVENLSSNKNDLFFHTMIYFSFPQMERNWTSDWFGGETMDMKQFIITNYKCIFGNIKDLFQKEFLEKESYYDNLYLYLYKYDKINSHYPNELLIRSMNHYFDYILRKRLCLKSFFAKNAKEVRKYFYKMCDIIDNLDRKRKLNNKNTEITLKINISLNDLKGGLKIIN